MSDDKIFAQGLYFDRKETYPSFIIGKLSFKVADVVAFLQKHESNAGYVNVDIKQSVDGKYYCQLNDYKPEKPKSITVSANDEHDQIPF